MEDFTMKFRRFLAAACAFTVALSSFSLSAFAASNETAATAATAETGATEMATYDVYKFDASSVGKLTWNDVVTLTGMTSASVGDKVEIVCSANEGATAAQVALKENSGWTALQEAAVTSADQKIEVEVKTENLTYFTNDQVVLQGDGITLKTVKFVPAGGTATTLYDSSTLNGLKVDYKEFTVSAAQLAELGITADNIAQCSVDVKFSSAPTAGVVGVDTGGNSLSLGYFDNITATSQTVSFKDIKYAWNGTTSTSEDGTADAIAGGLKIKVKDVNLSEIVLNYPSKTTEPDTPVDPDNPGTETATMTVGDASWAEDFNKAAQANITALPEGFVVGTTTYADIKDKTVTFKGVTLSNVSISSIQTSDITVSLYSQWGENADWKACYTNEWDMSAIEGVADTDVLKGFGFQLNVNGNVGGVDSMTIGDTFTVDYVNKGFTVSGGDEPEEPDPSEVDTSEWQVAVFAFGEGWSSNWTGTASENGVLTLSSTIGALMEKDGVSGTIGGINVQAWNVPIGNKVSFAILVKDKFGEVLLNDSGTHTVTETTNDKGETVPDYGLGQYCAPICWGEYNFRATDTIKVVVAPGSDIPTISDDPGDDPGTDEPSTPSTPSEPSTPSNPSTPSTPSESEDEVKFENSETKVEVSAPKDAFEKPEEVTFNAVPVPEETKDGKFTFDLSFTDKDNNEVQPKVAVTVRVPVPEDLKDKTVFVYHIEADGKYTEVSCKVEDGMVVFTANSFSKYVISETKLNESGAPAEETSDNSGDSNSSDTSDTSDTPNTPDTPNNPNTGVAALSLLPVAVAIAGVVIFKKKK